MNIHWLIPGNFKSLEDVSKSNIASIRLRAGLVGMFISNFQKKLTVGDHVNTNADVIIVGKIGIDCHNGRDNLWFRYLTESHEKSKKIIIDYTDNHLELNNSPVYNFYKKIMPITEKAVVPSLRMSVLLRQYFNNEINIIEDPVEIESFPPRISSQQNKTSLFWFGHSSNIPYLIKYLQNHSLCDAGIWLTVLTNAQGIDLLRTQKSKLPSTIEMNVSAWTLQNMIDASKQSDACLIPSDLNDPRKSGVSSNRLITAFALGLPVTADMLESYIPYSDCFHNIRKEPLSVFIKQLNFYIQKCEFAQKNIIGNFRKDIIANKWNSFFENLF